MKKIILMTLVLGVYSMPISASDVDSDYSMSHEYTAGPECITSSEQQANHSANPSNANTHDHNANSQQYSEDSEWVGATHRYDFDEFGYDEE